MPNSPKNPSRRNRNIGTAKSGHGQDNRLVIPDAWADPRMFWEKLVNPIEIPLNVHSLAVHVLVEPPSPGFTHACTVDDIFQVLQLIPEEHLAAIKLIVLRQAKRKEGILAPCWGRMAYLSEIGKHSGPAIFLEAKDLSRPQKRSRSMKPDEALELDRLREDGHLIVSDSRYHVINGTLETVRNTQLYRTLPHEVGHYVDFLESVVVPAEDDIDKELALSDLYWSKPTSDREAFAHRYADEFRLRCSANGLIPFERIFSVEKMRQQGLDPKWFTNPHTA